MEEKAEDLVKLLEEEGEVAADYLEELLDILDYDGDIVIDVENDRASVAVVTDEEDGRLERLVGDDGEVLEALQELTRLAVQTATGTRSRLMLDIDDFRADRKAELQELAAEAIEEIRGTGDSIALEPMNPFERKVCHDVAAEAGLFSQSAGADPDRYVVIYDATDDDETAESDDEMDEDANGEETEAGDSEGGIADEGGEQDLGGKDR